MKIFAPNFYKWQQKGSRIAWFDRIAKEKDVPLHAASGWSYLSEDQYNSMFSIYISKLMLKRPSLVNLPIYFTMFNVRSFIFKWVFFLILGMVDDFLKDIKIGGRDSIFELGCGTGAALKRLRSIYGSNLKVA